MLLPVWCSHLVNVFSSCCGYSQCLECSLAQDVAICWPALNLDALFPPIGVLSDRNLDSYHSGFKVDSLVVYLCHTTSCVKSFAWNPI